MTDRFPISGTRRGTLAEALDDEWRQLAVAPAVVGLANEWKLTDGSITTLDELLTATGYHHRSPTPGTVPSPSTSDPFDVDPDEANATLGHLVQVAATDPVAGRVVLQRILPGLRGAARAWWRGCRPAGIEAGRAFDELVAVAWEVITGYDVDRRPRNVAANLVRATVDRAFVGPTRRRAATEHLDDPATLDTIVTDPSAAASPSDELIGLLLDASRQRDADTGAIRLLGDLVGADGSTSVVADRYGVTARTIRTRRAQAITHVRHLVAT